MKKEELITLGMELEKKGRIEVFENGFIVDICDKVVDKFYTIEEARQLVISKYTNRLVRQVILYGIQKWVNEYIYYV